MELNLEGDGDKRVLNVVGQLNYSRSTAHSGLRVRVIQDDDALSLVQVFPRIVHSDENATLLNEHRLHIIGLLIVFKLDDGAKERFKLTLELGITPEPNIGQVDWTLWQDLQWNGGKLCLRAHTGLREFAIGCVQARNHVANVY